MAPTTTTGYLFAEHMMWHNPGHVQVRFHNNAASASRPVPGNSLAADAVAWPMHPALLILL